MKDVEEAEEPPVRHLTFDEAIAIDTSDSWIDVKADAEARVEAAIRKVERRRRERGIEVVSRSSEGGEVGEKTRDGDKPQGPEEVEGKPVVAKAGLDEVYRTRQVTMGMSEKLKEWITFSYETSDGTRREVKHRTRSTWFIPFEHHRGLTLDVAYIDLVPLTRCPHTKRISLSRLMLRELDLSPLAHLPELESLSVPRSRLKRLDLSPLLNCPKLHYLNIGHNPFEDVDPSPIAKMKSLVKLDVSGVKGAHPGLVRNSPELEWLTLGNCALSEPDLSTLHYNPKLTLLSLFKNKIREIDLEPLRIHKNSLSLGLSHNLLSSIDLAPLSGCEGLSVLDLCENQLSSLDLEPLRAHGDWFHLSLSHNRLSSIDLGFLNRRKIVDSLDIRDNRLSSIDLEPLRKFRIRRLHLEGNPLHILDVSPLFSCRGLMHFSVDEGVVLTADRSLKEQKRLPKATRAILDRITWK